MTGSQSPRTSRATSSSPRLKYPNVKNKESKHVSKHRLTQGSQNQRTSPVNGPVTPVRPGKRRHQAIVSPITTRTESASPKAKIRTISSPELPVKPKDPSIDSVDSSAFPSEIGSLLQLDFELGCTGSPLAVPKVSAEPPCPSLLPSPPQHWIGASPQTLAMKQQCRAITQSLVSHLASYGIVSAQ